MRGARDGEEGEGGGGEGRSIQLCTLRHIGFQTAWKAIDVGGECYDDTLVEPPMVKL